MSTDPYARAILTIVAVCLILLVAQGFGLGSGAAPQQTEVVPRYRVVAIPFARSILRMDEQTGEAWRFNLAAGGAWDRIEEPSASSPEPPSPEAEGAP